MSFNIGLRIIEVRGSSSSSFASLDDPDQIFSLMLRNKPLMSDAETRCPLLAVTEPSDFDPSNDFPKEPDPVSMAPSC